MYFVQIPSLIIKLFPSIIWDLPNAENKIYLTFDDGPHPEITPWILEKLKIYDAKATFFCLGKNVEKYPEIVHKILEEGHQIGNHGYAHLNGWKTKDDIYVDDIEKAKSILQKDDKMFLFRPPYGKIRKSQISLLKSHFLNLKSEIIILNWSLMAGDFDQSITDEKCYSNLQKVKSGDIIVMHDNEKSWKHLEYCLPKFLEEFKHYKFEKIG